MNIVLFIFDGFIIDHRSCLWLGKGLASLQLPNFFSHLFCSSIMPYHDHGSVPTVPATGGGKWNKKDVSNKCKAINAQRKRQQSSRSPSTGYCERPPGMPAFMPPDPREKVRKRKVCHARDRKRPAVGGYSSGSYSNSRAGTNVWPF